MKIESVLLENFGLYGGKRFRFDGQPLILIYGANETGKTTTLNGLRQTLFGFPHNTPYLTGKPMSAEGSVTLNDGRNVRFTRQKKRTDAFKATLDGKFPLNEAQWLELAGGLDLKSYQSLFGFSLEELRSGEKALAHAPLNAALSGSGFGGLARLQQVQSRIDGFLSSTLKRNGTGGTINAKLAEIDAAEKQLESVLTLPSDVAELREKLAKAREVAEQFGGRLQELRLEYERCQRQQEALPRAIEYRQVMESLRVHHIPNGIDEEFRLQWTVTQNRLAGTRSELAIEQRKLEQLQGSLEALPAASMPIAVQAEIRRLAAEAQQIVQQRRQLASDLRELEELHRELNENLRRIGYSNECRQWRTIELDLTQRAELDGARQLSETLTSQLTAARARRDAAAEQLRKHATIFPGEVVPENIDELESLVRTAQPLAGECDQLLQRLNDQKNEPGFVQRKEKLLALTRQLAGAVATPEFALQTDWRVPPTTAVAKHQQQVAQATAQFERLAKELEGRDREIVQLQHELSETQATLGLISFEDLEAIWRERDRLIAEWRDELDTPLISAHVPPAELQQRLTKVAELNAQSDTAVRNLLASADRVAALVGQQQRLKGLQAQRSDLAQEVELARKSTAMLATQWLEMWRQCPFTPASPERMAAWLEDFRSWLDVELNVQRLASECARATVERDTALAELRKQWPQSQAAYTSLADAQTQLSRWRSSAAARKLHIELLTDLKTRQRHATTECEQLEQQLANCRSVYRQLAATLQLPDTWPMEEIAVRLDALQRCQSLAGRVENLGERAQAAQQSIDEFSRAVSTHAQLLGRECSLPVEPEQQVQAWLEELTLVEKADKQRLDLTTATKSTSEALAKWQAQVVQLEQTLEQLAKSVGASSSEEVQAWITSANTVFQLRAQKAQLAAALEANASRMPLDQFLEELATLEPRSVTAAAASLAAQMSSAEASRRAALEQLGSLSRELEFKEQGSAAMECEQRLKRLRSELVELSEQWVVHRLAGELLERTIDRFTRDNEPQLLKHTRRFFRELTEDRYCVVEHDSGKHGGFAVRDQQGHAWQPDKLSTGAREQLYLAIRLAFITHFNEHHEPLPVIMDDCFVNFDDSRARNALRTLIHWQESVQTIMLSCHWQSVQALAELAPETPVITISTGEVMSAKQLLDRAEMVAGANPAGSGAVAGAARLAARRYTSDSP